MSKDGNVSNQFINVIDEVSNKVVNKALRENYITARKAVLVADYNAVNNTASVILPTSPDIPTIYYYPNKSSNTLSANQKVYLVYQVGNISQGWIEDGLAAPRYYTPTSHDHIYQTWIGSQLSTKSGYIGFYDILTTSIRRGWMGFSGQDNVLSIMNDSGAGKGVRFGQDGVQLSLNVSGGYWGFDGVYNDYLRVGIGGIIPNRPTTSGLGNVGTSAYRFSDGNFNTLHTNNWFRSEGNSGWFNETYSGGIYMKDSTYVRVYNSKQFLVENRCLATSFAILNSSFVCTTGDGVSSFRAVADAASTTGSYFEIRTTFGAKGINWWNSDKRLKDNIKRTRVTNALTKLSKLKHIEFDWKDHKGHCPLGYVANDISKILPCLTFDVEQPDNEDGTKNPSITHINHTTLIPLVTMGIQELIEENKYLWDYNNASCDTILNNCKEIEVLKEENKKLNLEITELKEQINTIVNMLKGEKL